MNNNNLVILVAESQSLKGKIVLEYFLHNSNLNRNGLKVAYYGDESGDFIDLVQSMNIECFKTSWDLDPIDFLRNSKGFTDVCIVLIGWPYIVKANFLSEFKNRVINCHGSYLPDYKGSRAYMHYWANIHDYYGASIHYVSEKIDEGNIIKRIKVKQFPEESPIIIHRRIAELTGLILGSAIQAVFTNYLGQPQEKGGRYFKKILKEEFIQIREYNESKEKKNRITTPYKYI